MQINGTSCGPTMAASEPPEPPPRNPDRINASLHKLSESKNVKSLDSSHITAINEKITNNNKSLKTILSLDHTSSSSQQSLATTTTTTAATIPFTIASCSSFITSVPPSASSSIAITTAAASAKGSTSSSVTTANLPVYASATTAAAQLYQKRQTNDNTIAGSTSSSNSSGSTSAGTGIATITGTAGIGDSSSPPISSNGSSNHTLTSPPMIIDNQLQQLQHQHQHQQQQQQQQQRYSFTNPLISMHQQQQQRIAAGNILIEQHQQLVNGSSSAGSSVSGSGNGTTSSGNGSGSGSVSTLNSNNSNTNHISSVHQQQQLATAAAIAVDKKNANDVCSIVKLMDLGGITTSAAAAAEVTTNILTASTIVGTATTTSTSMTTMANSCNINSCDSNRNNDESRFNFHSDSPIKLREENERLSTEVARLRKLLENSPEGAVGGIDLSDSNSCGDAQSTDGSGSTPRQRYDRLESELRSARNQLMALRIERKKLRADKNELLQQVKELCSSLHDKEQELRGFIRNFQDRVRESETNNAKKTGDRERERWQLLKQARDEAERSLALAQQLNARDMQLQRLQEQLQEARRQLSGCLSDQESLLSFAPLTPPSANSGLLSQMVAGATVSGSAGGGSGGGGGGSGGGSGMRTDDSGRGNSNSLSAFSGSSGATAGDRNSCSNDSVLRNSSDRESTGGDLNFSDNTCENGPCITVDPDSISLVSSQNMYQFGTPKERSPTLSPLNSAAYSRSVEQLGSPVDSEGPGLVTRKFAPKTAGTLSARNGRGGTWGSISRVFARSRNKSKALSADGATEYTDYTWSPLSEEGYAEKLRLLREASQLPMERWRASQVVAWLEVALGMPQYSTRCGENVKSGKVLLELNDAELDAGLGLTHPMHRKKLRLAIEEQRRPEMVRYPMITQLGHTWVASEWLPDIGLPQYAEPFMHSLVDARMLDTLSKKELEKFLGVTRKFHQASVVHGIHVLRIVKYDRQTLAMRRVQSDAIDTDPIVWTNQRFIRWARSIDLGEYADNLKDSGVHGGLVVLEPSFSGDTMATALGIPPSKNIIRRHLATEFDALILPARATLGQGIRSGCGIVPITGPGGLQHYATADRRSSGAIRSSLSKAFRFNAKSSRSSIGDRSSFGNSTSPTPSYSSSEGGGGGIYATIGPTLFQHYPPPTTAPPPPPAAAAAGTPNATSSSPIVNYGPPGHRVSAPPVSSSTLDAFADTALLYEQHRRVKSISDIGGVTATTTLSSRSSANGSIGYGGGGGGGASSIGGSIGGSLGGTSLSSDSPV